MPELPEVETTVKDLEKLIIGLSIKDVWTNYDSKYFYGKEQIKNPKYFKKFKKEILNQKIIGTSRRGKNVLIHLNNKKTILVHMKMTGHLLYGAYVKTLKHPTSPRLRRARIRGDDTVWKPKVKTGPLNDRFNGWIRLVFSLSNKKHLVLSDLRKFAKVTLLDTEKIEHSPDISHIGPEILENFTSKDFIKRIKKYPKKKIKQILLDQTFVAGIGNIYSDEALWLARIHPETLVHKLSEEKLKLLFKEIKKVLNKGIDFNGDSMSDYRRPNGEPGKFQNEHQVYLRNKKPCNRKSCKGIIEKVKVGGRSAHFCPVCQK